jgi:hypothetical protein
MWRSILFSLVLALILSGCGGGGGGGGGGGSDNQPEQPSQPEQPNQPDQPNQPEPPSAAPVPNQLPIIVHSGVTDSVNVPFVSVTLCDPGTSNCQTIDDVILDTGSTGLRIISSALAPSLTLPLAQTGSGGSLSECMQFVSGYTWGAIRSADVKLAGHTLENLSIQVIGDTEAGSAPERCTAIGDSLNTVQSFGGNGILGVGVFVQDCGRACAGTASSGMYYACSGAGCQPTRVELGRQVHNPVALLGSDNNGVVVELPAIASSGAFSVDGTLTLGIGTQANNSLENAMVLGVNADDGTLVTRFNGADYKGFFDSGSNGIFFPNRGIPTCGGFYCPASVQHLSATNTGTNDATSSVDFQIDNARDMFRSGNFAFDKLGGPYMADGSFDWGLPFFFGRKVFTAIEERNTPGGAGPYIAY